jgi:LysM repeat protein
MFFFTSFLFCVSAAHAQEPQETSAQQNQSVADAARQQRARKEEQQKTAKHVYTEEDLKRKQILTPEDQAKVEARKNACAAKNNCGPAPEQNAPAALDANGKSAQPSLGEIARELRKQKELEALKPKQSEPFHLPMDNPVLASPIVPERSTVRPPVPPVLRPEDRSSENHSNVFRRDPFAPLPTRPRVPFRGVSQLHPTVPPAAHFNSLPAPKISPRAAAPNFPVAPTQPSKPTLESSTATPKSRPGEILPVRPSLLARSRRATSSAPPSRIFPAVKPAAPLGILPAAPAAPAASVNPAQPVPAPRQPVAPVLAKTVRVQPGDSLWKLALRSLGRGTLWTAIARANPAVANPNHLRPGENLVLPARSPEVAATPSTSAETAATVASFPTIKIHKGDTLWSLAKANLGRAANWPCLAAANPAVVDPNRIFEGQELLVPSTCSPAISSFSRAN